MDENVMIQGYNLSMKHSSYIIQIIVITVIIQCTHATFPLLKLAIN